MFRSRMGPSIGAEASLPDLLISDNQGEHTTSPWRVLEATAGQPHGTGCHRGSVRFVVRQTNTGRSVGGGYLTLIRELHRASDARDNACGTEDCPAHSLLEQ